ncbi:MAG: hypothetical protein OXG05_06790 [Gammaproteobacteria bacterium]|nr:hypothetical protein [Gammaproteobacteria bacterium]
MSPSIGFSVICTAFLSCTLVLGQATEISVPHALEDRYVTEDFGNCTFHYGKDRSRYVQPFVTCITGNETFMLVPQEDGSWGLLITAGDETERSEEDAGSSSLDVTVKVGDNDAHEFSMWWPRRWNMALDSLKLAELIPLINELRDADSMTVTRNEEVIEFDLSRANQVFVELLFEQLVALSKVESSDRE